jgi:glutamine synthetase
MGGCGSPVERRLQKERERKERQRQRKRSEIGATMQEALKRLDTEKVTLGTELVSNYVMR